MIVIVIGRWLSWLVNTHRNIHGSREAVKILYHDGLDQFGVNSDNGWGRARVTPIGLGAKLLELPQVEQGVLLVKGVRLGAEYEKRRVDGNAERLDVAPEMKMPYEVNF